MKLKITVIFLWIFLKFKFQLDPFYEGKKKIIYLNEKNINNVIEINSNRYLIFLFYKPNPKINEDNLKQYYKFIYVKNLKDKNYTLTLIDCKLEKNICDKFFIWEYPTILFIHKKLFYRFEQNKFTLYDLEKFITKDYLNYKPEKLEDQGTLILKLKIIVKKLNYMIKNINKKYLKLFKITILFLLVLFILKLIVKKIKNYRLNNNKLKYKNIIKKTNGDGKNSKKNK